MIYSIIHKLGTSKKHSFKGLRSAMWKMVNITFISPLTHKNGNGWWNALELDISDRLHNSEHTNYHPVIHFKGWVSWYVNQSCYLRKKKKSKLREAIFMRSGKIEVRYLRAPPSNWKKLPKERGEGGRHRLKPVMSQTRPPKQMAEGAIHSPRCWDKGGKEQETRQDSFLLFTDIFL